MVPGGPLPFSGRDGRRPFCYAPNKTSCVLDSAQISAGVASGRAIGAWRSRAASNLVVWRNGKAPAEVL
jgi:hypothetical protein